MEAVILIGLQASGKSTLCRERFFATHLRLNLDMLRTRHRERRLLAVCVETGLRFVVDNTNVTAAERAVYIAAARRHQFRVVGIVFRTPVAECRRRNASRAGAARVPDRAIGATAARYEPPTLGEGFDELFAADPDGDGFRVERLAGGG